MKIWRFKLHRLAALQPVWFQKITKSFAKEYETMKQEHNNQHLNAESSTIPLCQQFVENYNPILPSCQTSK
jgi:cell fate (sporulation/competence/biofilm development) regulator YmcA (YheA/YmcA/DUF963 family)